MRKLFIVLAAALGLAVLGAPIASAAPRQPSTANPAAAVPVSQRAEGFDPAAESVTQGPTAAQVYGDAAASSGGCTASPDSWGKANFRPACDKHDVCYSAGSAVDRSVCDSRFRTDLHAVCNATYSSSSPLRYTCRGIAETYYAAVRTFGGGFYQGSGARG